MSVNEFSAGQQIQNKSKLCSESIIIIIMFV